MSKRVITAEEVLRNALRQRKPVTTEDVLRNAHRRIRIRVRMPGFLDELEGRSSQTLVRHNASDFVKNTLARVRGR